MPVLSFRVRLSHALLGLSLAALFACTSSAPAQGLSPSAPKVTLGSPTSGSEAGTPAIFDIQPSTEPAVLPAQGTDSQTPSPVGAVQPKDAIQPAPAGETAPTVQDPAKWDWTKSPKPAFIPRTGLFRSPRTGPGYYSILDNVTGNLSETPPKFGYPRFAIMTQGMFDVDWRYVDQPGYEPDLLERLHRIHLNDDWMFGTGGEFRIRYNNEVNSRLSGKDNNYDLTRTRVFADLWYRDTFRIYAEFISAQTFNQDLAPLIFDRDYADLLNAFVDVKLYQDAAGVPWYVRAGRQELYFGSQRLISGLDWVNTLRTFEGIRAFRHGEKFDFDMFYTNPVIPSAGKFDSADHNQRFAGTWAEYRPNKNQMLDLYWLYYDNEDQYNAKTKTPVPVGEFPFAPYRINTFGFRFAGNGNDERKNILFDFENMLQLGHSDFANASTVAGASTSGLGYHFANLPMNPSLWAYVDYASGGNSLTAGQQSTFNQMFPFGHPYFGWMDYVARQNIIDYNTELYLYPTNWLTLSPQFHCFQLASATDALYGAGGSILRYDPTGKSGRDVGRELDLIANFHVSKRQDVMFAYGHLWEGRFLRSTGPGNSAETCWLMYTVRW